MNCSLNCSTSSLKVGSGARTSLQSLLKVHRGHGIRFADNQQDPDLTPDATSSKQHCHSCTPPHPWPKLHKNAELIRSLRLL